MTYDAIHNEFPHWGHDYQAHKPWAKFIMCTGHDTSQDSEPNISKILALKEENERLYQLHLSDKLDGQVHLRVDDYLASSYLALHKSLKRTLDISDILAPLKDFGEFLGDLLPSFSVTIQDYIKLPLQGPPEYIMAFTASIQVPEDACDVLNGIGDAIKELSRPLDPGLKLYNTIWPEAVAEFCGGSRSLEAKISVGFQGFYVDLPNTYIMAHAGTGSSLKLSMDMLPVSLPCCSLHHYVLR